MPMSIVTKPAATWDDQDLIRIGVLALCIPQLLFAVGGLIAHPSFATGGDLSSEVLAGVDFNGWHALSGLLIYLPGLAAAMSARWSRRFCWIVSATLVITGLWPLWDTTPLGLLHFAHPLNDTVFHFLSATSFLVLLGLTRPNDQR